MRFLYVVRIVRGRSHSEHSIFLHNVSKINAKSGGYGGINAVCVLSHHLDQNTVHLLCSDGMKGKSDVTVEEITRESLKDQNGEHPLFLDLVERYFLPYGDYPNIE